MKLILVLLLVLSLPNLAWSANRYWVGGTGSWSDATNHWATSSGGSPGVGNTPTYIDDVFVDSSSGFSGGGTLTLDVSNPQCHDFTCTSGHTYTITTSASPPDLIPYGSMTLETGITMTGINLSFNGAGTGRTFTTAGVTQYSIYIYNGTISLQDDLTVSQYVSVYGGTFDANNHNVTVASVNCTSASNATLNMGSGTWTLTGSSNPIWYIPSSGITVNSGTSTIKFTDASSTGKTFNGGGKTYNNVWFTGIGTGAYTIIGSNTFNDFKVDTPPHTVKFTGATTTTVSSFTVIGTSGNLITIDSVDGVTQHILSKASGTVVCDFLNLSNSNATGGATWSAGHHSLDTSNNDGWLFPTISIEGGKITGGTLK